MARTASVDLIKRRVSQFAPELLLLGELAPPQAVDDEWDWDATVEVVDELRDRLGDKIIEAVDHAGLWKSLLDVHARNVLGGTPLAGTVDAVMAEAWERYYDLEPTVPVERNLGAVFTTHLAAATLALHDTLVRHGVAADEASRLLHDIGWKFYTHMGEAAMLLVKAFTRDPYKRMRLATQIFRTFPFGAQGYRWQDMPGAEDVVAFDCTKCPVAEFFAKHEASEVCVQTWCSLDFPLAELWGGRLERTGSIAGGARVCDFRWHVDGKKQQVAKDAPA